MGLGLAIYSTPQCPRALTVHRFLFVCRGDVWWRFVERRHGIGACDQLRASLITICLPSHPPNSVFLGTHISFMEVLLNPSLKMRSLWRLCVLGRSCDGSGFSTVRSASEMTIQVGRSRTCCVLFGPFLLAVCCGWTWCLWSAPPHRWPGFLVHGRVLTGSSAVVPWFDRASHVKGIIFKAHYFLHVVATPTCRV